MQHTIDHPVTAARPTGSPRVVEIAMLPPTAGDTVEASRSGTGRSSATLIGAGRSAKVYRVRDERGREIARKVFEGDPLAKLVLVALTGAPNPYTWCDAAVQAALCRRRILRRLVTVWFGDDLRLPRLDDSSWNDEHRAMQIEMEFIRGRAPKLPRPGAPDGGAEMRALTHDIMKPLQRHLIESGFDGLVWQAGLGNPVASSNFLIETDRSKNGVHRWVWIDLESGVPALFPLNPWSLIRFYLPRSVRHRGALFDDVSSGQLRAYIMRMQGGIEHALGPGAADALLDEAMALERHQSAWKGMSRLDGSVTYALVRGHLSLAEATFYRTHPFRWYARVVRRGITEAPDMIGRAARRVWRKVFPTSVFTTMRAAGRFLFSQRRRTRYASHIIRKRIRSWERRRQMQPERAAVLCAHVRSDEATAYLTDFGIHLAIKAPVKFTEWLVFPLLFAAGLISQQVLLIALASGGAIGRSAYTLWRTAQATARGRERPWVALITGVLPVVGNAAYPLQILYTSAEKDHDVARFILVDLFTAIGRKLPIWGGPDTQTEHFFNRIPIWFLRRIGRIGAPEEPAAAGAMD